MSGNTLVLRSPQDRVIVPYVCNHEAIASYGFQLQITGEETLELHNFVSSIIAGDVEVQEGVSIVALGELAAILGHSLKPLGEYFTTLSDATWHYAEACRIGGDLTKHMPERQSNLQGSLAQLVTEEENVAAVEQSVKGLGEDDTASGYLIRYSVLNEEGILNESPNAVVLDGMKRDDALRFIETNKSSLETLKESVHSRNEGMLADFDTAVTEWEDAAHAFTDSLDGILGPLQDTEEENLYQKDGKAGDVAGAVAGTAGVLILIPFPPLQGAALVVGLLATVFAVAGAGSQAYRVIDADNRDIRTVDGQVAGEVGQTAKAAGGFVSYFKALRLLGQGKSVKPGTPSGNPEDMPDRDAREASPPVDVGVDVTPIDRWQERADESNPEYTYVPNTPYDTTHAGPDDAPVTIPEASGDEAGTGTPEPTGISVETGGNGG